MATADSGGVNTARGLWWHGHLLGHGPQAADQFPRHGDADLMGMLALRSPLAIPWAAPDWCLPADGLERGGKLLQTAWQVPTDCGRVPGGPGPFDPGPTAWGLPGVVMLPC